MEQNNVLISIKGMQSLEDGQEETMELITEGSFHGKDSSFTLTYEESEITGLGSTKTTFQIESERITLLREGEVNSQMVFEEGRRHLSMYNTPFGAMSIGVNTRRMRKELSVMGGDIEIEYAMEIDHALAGQNIFQIQVKQKETGVQQ